MIQEIFVSEVKAFMESGEDMNKVDATTSLGKLISFLKSKNLITNKHMLDADNGKSKFIFPVYNSKTKKLESRTYDSYSKFQITNNLTTNVNPSNRRLQVNLVLNPKVVSGNKPIVPNAPKSEASKKVENAVKSDATPGSVDFSGGKKRLLFGKPSDDTKLEVATTRRNDSIEGLKQNSKTGKWETSVFIDGAENDIAGDTKQEVLDFIEEQYQKSIVGLKPSTPKDNSEPPMPTEENIPDGAIISEDLLGEIKTNEPLDVTQEDIDAYNLYDELDLVSTTNIVFETLVNNKTITKQC